MTVDPRDNMASAPVGEISSEAKTWGMLCHLSALAGYVVPFGNIIGPLIVWQIKRNENEFVDDQGKESLNFQITITIAAFIAALTLFIIIGVLLLPAVLLFGLVMVVIAAISASNGTRYRYPLSIRLVK